MDPKPKMPNLSQFAPVQIPPPFPSLLPPAQVSPKTRPGKTPMSMRVTVTSQIPSCLEGWIGWRWYWQDVMGVDATLTMRAWEHMRNSKPNLLILMPTLGSKQQPSTVKKRHGSMLQKRGLGHLCVTSCTWLMDADKSDAHHTSPHRPTGIPNALAQYSGSNSRRGRQTSCTKVQLGLRRRSSRYSRKLCVKQMMVMNDYRKIEYGVDKSGAWKHHRTIPSQALIQDSGKRQ